MRFYPSEVAKSRISNKQETHFIVKNHSSLFLFISLTKIKQSRKGHLETSRKEKSSYYWAWDLETRHSYQLLASLKTVQYRSLWATNMKYLLLFCLLKTLNVSGMCGCLWFRGTRFKLDSRAEVLKEAVLGYTHIISELCIDTQLLPGVKSLCVCKWPSSQRALGRLCFCLGK